jgi:hypothetical protein
MSWDDRLYFTRDELAVVQTALEVYLTALRGMEFGDEKAEGDHGMRARHNLATSARRKVLDQRNNRER